MEWQLSCFSFYLPLTWCGVFSSVGLAWMGCRWGRMPRCRHPHSHWLGCPAQFRCQMGCGWGHLSRYHHLRSHWLGCPARFRCQMGCGWVICLAAIIFALTGWVVLLSFAVESKCGRRDCS